MENSKHLKMLCFPIHFTEEDLTHCSNCIDLVEYLLDPDTDGELRCITTLDLVYLSGLLSRECQIMREVIESSEDSDYVIQHS